MKNFSAGAFFAAIFILAGAAAAMIAPTSSQVKDGASRAGSFSPNGWTIVNCSNVAAATSTVLPAKSTVIIQCFDDSYIAFGGSAVADADSSDGILPDKEWLRHLVLPDANYFSCLNVNADQDCRWIEAR